MSRPTPKRLVEAENVLRDLKAWARIERSLESDHLSPRALVWGEIIGWARGRAAKLELDLDQNERLTNDGRLQRQGRIFNHSGKCGKIITK